MPEFVRYSAVEMFGAPIDAPESMSDDPSGMRFVDVMRAHGIDGTELPEGLTDLTPYYWENNAFRYFLSFSIPQNLATVEILPVHASSAMNEPGLGPDEDPLAFEDQRTVQIPTRQPIFPLLGGSPRYPGMLCIHEVIQYRQ